MFIAQHFSFIFLFLLLHMTVEIPIQADDGADRCYVNDFLKMFKKSSKFRNNRDLVHDFIKKEFCNIEQVDTGFIPKKSRDSIMCFTTGAVAGVALVLSFFSVFYACCSCQKSLDKNDLQEAVIPGNFQQKNNWCWMVAVLQALYPLSDLREWIDKKAAENMEVVDGHGRARIKLAKSLQVLFTAMQEHSRVKSLQQEQAQNTAAENFYNDLFQVHKEINFEGICPDSKGKGYDGLYFLQSLQTLLFQSQFDMPMGVVLDHDDVVPIPALSEGQSVLDVVKAWTSENADEREKLITSKKIVPFSFQCSKRESTIIDEKITLYDKNYELASLVLRRPVEKNVLGHSISLVCNQGLWYLFDSFDKEPKNLTSQQVQNLLKGQGYLDFKPRLVFYNQI